MAQTAGQVRAAGWVESLPAALIAITGFFAILVGGVLNVVTIPPHARAFASCGSRLSLGAQFVVAVSEFTRHHVPLTLAALAVFFTALVLLARRLGWRTGMVLAILTILIFLVIYPVMVICVLFPGPIFTV